MEKLILRGLSAGYGGRPVVEELTAELRSGEIMALVGPNGAGKSTVLKTVARQLLPLGGAVFLDGRDMAAMTGGEIARSLSLVLTDRLDGELLTCEEVVCSGRYPYTGRLGILSPRDREKAAEAMERLRVTELGKRDFRRLSDGQRQRVLLARAICQEPKVLVLDEPTSFLDIRYKLELLDTLRELSGEGLAVILSLHELELARALADTVLCIRDGRVDRMGPPREILTPAYIEALYGLSPGSYEACCGADSAEAGPHYAFFQNRACEMFPCHKGVSEGEFNCLFCYCPLYCLGPSCGGQFTYTEQGRKDCSGCAYPHARENYRAVLQRYPEIAALAGQAGPPR